MERLRLTRFDIPLFWVLLDWSMSRFVDSVGAIAGLSSSRVLSPIEFIYSRESLGHGPIRVVQEYQSPIGPRAPREETGRSIKVSLSEIVLRKMTADGDDVIRTAPRHRLRQKQSHICECPGGIHVPVDALCDSLQFGVHSDSRRTPSPML